jgi:hypothetical protein
MKTLHLESPTHTFRLEDWGHWSLRPNNAICHEEESCSGHIKTQQDRVALAAFLRQIADTLATPKRPKG